MKSTHRVRKRNTAPEPTATNEALSKLITQEGGRNAADHPLTASSMWSSVEAEATIKATESWLRLRKALWNAKEDSHRRVPLQKRCDGSALGTRFAEPAKACTEGSREKESVGWHIELIRRQATDLSDSEESTEPDSDQLPPAQLTRFAPIPALPLPRLSELLPSHRASRTSQFMLCREAPPLCPLLAADARPLQGAPWPLTNLRAAEAGE